MSADNVESLKKKYEDLAAKVNETAPNTPERFHAMEAKKKAFAEFKAAEDAKVHVEVATAQAEQKQNAAEAAVKDAAAAKKAAAEAASPRRTVAGRNDPSQQPQDTAPKQKP